MTNEAAPDDGQGTIVNPQPDTDSQDWDGDEADRADRLRFAEEQALIREQSERHAAAADTNES